MRPLAAGAALILLILGAAVAPAPAALAADDPGATTWSVAPATLKGRDDRASFAYAVDPGTQIRDFVVISNFGDTPGDFSVYATDAITEFDTGAFSLRAAAEEPTDLGAWTATQVDSIRLDAAQAAVVPFEILVPSDATPGDHAAGIVASISTTSVDENGQAITLEQRVAARIYLHVSGEAAASVEATGLVANYSFSWNPFGSGSASVDYAVTNTGNVRVDVAQSIAFTGPFGIELGRIATAEPVVNLLPGQAAHQHFEADGIFGLLLLWGTVTLEPGPPTDLVAQSHEQRADGSPAEPRPEAEYSPSTAEAVTGAVPWTLLALLVLLAIAIWLVARYVRSTRERMYEAIDEAAEQARRQAERDADRLHLADRT